MEALDAALQKDLDRQEHTHLMRKCKKLSFAQGELGSVKPNKATYMKRGDVFFQAPAPQILEAVQGKLKVAEDRMKTLQPA